MVLNSMANLLRNQYEREDGSRADWDRCIRIAKIAVGSEPSMASRVLYMHTLSVALTERYIKYNEEKDLMQAIEYGLRCPPQLFAVTLGSRDIPFRTWNPIQTP